MIKFENVSLSYKANATNNNIKELVKSLFCTRKSLILENISLSLDSNIKYAILGLNGSGKSTFLKLLLGIIQPSSGNIFVNEYNVKKKRPSLQRNCGVVWGQRTTLWWDLSLFDCLKTYSKIYHLSDQNFKERVSELNSILNFKEFWKNTIRQLSLGQRVKADFAAALLHKPSLLVLDEPFLGLDIISHQLILDYLNKIQKRDKITIIFTSHNIHDVINLADKLIIINNKRVEKIRNINELKTNNSIFYNWNIKFKDRIDIDKVKNIRNKYSASYTLSDNNKHLEFKIHASKDLIDVCQKELFSIGRLQKMQTNDLTLIDQIEKLLKDQHEGNLNGHK